MITTDFIKVDQQSINLNKAISYLQNSGKLGSFVNEIIRQYILEQELAKVELPNGLVTETIGNFCKSNQLTPEKFEQWLRKQNQTRENFTRKITQSIKLHKLIIQISTPKLSEYFINKKLILDRLVLSRLIVKEQELAEELKSQIIEEGEIFEQLAQEYSLAEDRLFNGMMGTISRGQLPDKLRAVIDTARVKEIVGPLEIDNYWCLFRVEQILPASMADEKLKEKLRENIFEDWLIAKMQKLEIEMNLNN